MSIVEEYDAIEREARERGEAAAANYFGPPWANFEPLTKAKMWDIAQQMCPKDYHGDTQYYDIEDIYIQLIQLIWMGRHDLRQR